MITIQNLDQKIKEIDWSKFPKGLKEVKEEMPSLIPFYKKDQDIKSTIDLFIDMLNDRIKEQDQKIIDDKNIEHNKSTKAKPKKIKDKKEQDNKPTKTKTKKNKTISEHKPIIASQIPVSVKILKRYIAYANTTHKTKKKLIHILQALQKGIVKTDITSKSPFANLVMKVQNDIVKRLNNKDYMNLNKAHVGEILAKDLDKIKAYKQSPITNALIAKQGNNTTLAKKYLEKAKNLKKNKAQQEIMKNIQNTNPKSMPTLKGIKTAHDIKAMTFEVFDMGVFNPLFGTPSLPFYAMIHGKPGSGKSTFSLMLAGYLATKGKKILYVSKEEGYTATMQNKLNLLNIDSKNLHLTDYLIEAWIDYDFVFFDSANSLRLGFEEFYDLIQNAKQKGISLFFIFQATKAGNFRGSLEYEHEVDVSLIADNGIIKPNKNRFGGNGAMKVF